MITPGKRQSVCCHRRVNDLSLLSAIFVVNDLATYDLTRAQNMPTRSGIYAQNPVELSISGESGANFYWKISGFTSRDRQPGEWGHAVALS